MKIAAEECPFPLGREFLAILEQEIEKVGARGASGGILNVRDPDYSAESGGFHPVEIRISEKGAIQYITDMAYVGVGPYAELAKEIDFDFSLGLFQHFGKEHPIEAGRDLYRLWEENFVSLYHIGVYTVSFDPA